MQWSTLRRAPPQFIITFLIQKQNIALLTYIDQDLLTYLPKWSLDGVTHRGLVPACKLLGAISPARC
jgi:hypothetical protein